MWEKLFAAAGLLACLLVWASMALGPARRQRLLGTPGRLWRSLRTRRAAQREAADAIARARQRAGVQREGNVYRPESFGHRRASDRDKGDETLH